MPFEISSSEKKGWFSLTLFRKNWGRFWPLAAGYGAIQFLLLPMAFLNMTGYRGERIGDVVSSAVRSATENAVYMGLVFGLLVAMALFSYLMNHRSTGMLHALPMRREGLFLSNWVTGLSFFLVPNALVTLVTFVAESMKGYVTVGLTLRWFALHTVIAMFFFCFATCCAMFTGHILALPVFYGVLNVLVMGLSILVDNALSVLLMGYTGIDAAYSDLSVWCTPAWHLHNLVVSEGYGLSVGTAGALGYSIVAGAAFTLIAGVTYHHRQLERAGDVVTVAWVRPIFQYGLGVCLGLTLGTVLYENFFRGLGSWGFVALVALCGFLGTLIGRMFLKKSLRVLSEGWKGCVALTLCLVFLLGGARADLFGYQRWTPKAEEVEKVIITSLYTAPHDDASGSMSIEDPELMEELIAIHQGITDQLERVAWAERNNIYETDGEGYETASGTSLRIYYQMKDGREIARKYYSIPVAAQELEDPESYAARLQALLNRPELLRESYLDWMDSSYELEGGPVGGWLSNTKGTEGEDPTLDYVTAGKLWDAFLEDLEAGRIHRYLLDNKEREENCYYTDIYFTLNQTYVDENGERKTLGRDLCVTVQKSATSMMKVLEEMGAKELLASRREAVGVYTERVTQSYRIYEAESGELAVIE